MIKCTKRHSLYIQYVFYTCELQAKTNTFSLPKRNILPGWQIVSILRFRPPNTSLYYEFEKIHKNRLELMYVYFI